MQRVSRFHENVVGDVHHVVDGAKTDGFEAPFHPFRARPDLQALDGPSEIQFTIFGLDGNLPKQVVGRWLGDGLSIRFELGELNFTTIVCSQFSGHAEVAQAVTPVRGEL